MKQLFACGLVACVLAGTCVGCAQPAGVVRAQSPVGDGLAAAPAAQFVPMTQPLPGQVVPAHHQHQPIDPPVMSAAPTYYGNGNCPGGAGQYCEGDWVPTHVNSFYYKPPANLRYPMPNTPAAVIQYPYYTCKGPDDFFYPPLNQ